MSSTLLHPPVRYPKGPLAMTVVYGFTGGAILTSIVFSLLLFLSIDKDPLMMGLFGALAVIFELGKFYVWYELGERRARRDGWGTCYAFLFYAVLAIISIGGSIGGISSATDSAYRQEEARQRQEASYDLRIAAIEQEITLNEEAARRYIELNRISTGLSQMTKRNQVLREQQQVLREERARLPVEHQASMLSLIAGLAGGMQLNEGQVQFWLIVALSILLDFFTAFFIGVIGDEMRFRRHERRRHEAAAVTPVALAVPPIPAPQALPSEALDGQPTPPSAYQQVLQALKQGEVACSKTAVARQLALAADEIDAIFHRLLEENVVLRKPNRHFELAGDAS